MDRRPRRLRVQPADLPRLRGRRLRPADRLRDRRLHRDAGLRRRGRGRLADRRARPHDVRDDIVVRDLGRETPVRGSTPRTAGGYRSPATAAMLDMLGGVAARYESRRPRLELVG